MNINIVINLQFEGIHNWPEVNIAAVEFLKYPHRHIFHITCKKYVSHTERDIEIINLKRSILSWLNKTYPKGELGSTSCELLAVKLCKEFDLTYCQVLEDNENGAEVDNKFEPCI